jgi:hypothetical protein
MTIYELDMLQFGSLSRLPSTQEIFELSRYICIDILRFLQSSLVAKAIQEFRVITNYIISLRRYLDIMITADPKRTGVSYAINVLQIFVEKQMFGSSGNSGQIFTMRTLGNVHTANLIEIMSVLLKNSIKHACPFWSSLSTSMIKEHQDFCEEMISDLKLIFPVLTIFTRPTFVNFKMRVEFQDHIFETKNLVVATESFINKPL